MEDVRGTPRPVAFGEPRNCAVVQKFDPFDRSVDAVAVADGEAGEAFVLFIPGGYFLPCFLLKSLKSLVEVSDSLGVLLHIPVMDPVLLLDGFDEGRGELAKSDRIPDVKTLYEVSHRRWGDGVGMGSAEVGDGHEGCCGGARGSVWCHRDVGVRGTEWERVRRVSA